jgi:hypothetical protein
LQDDPGDDGTVPLSVLNLSQDRAG